MIPIKIKQIKDYMPHRYPFLLVDRVLEFDAGKTILALKNVTCNEEFFNGHFPERPIMPGVLQIEAMAQAAGLLIFFTTNTNSDLYYLAGVDKARFKGVVEPGDQVHLHATVLRRRRDVWVFETKATVDGKLVCSAEILLVKELKEKL